MNIQKRKEFIQAECDKLRTTVSLKGGRLSVQDKLAAFFDENTFVESGAFVSENTSFSGAAERGAEGVVTGYGAVNGRLVFCCVQDYSRDCGALSLAGAGKIAAAYEAAARNGAPIVTVYDSDGAKLTDGVNAVAAFGKVLKAAADVKGIVPQIAVVTGVCSGGMAAVAENADVVVMGGKNARLSLSPASVLKTAGADEDTAGGDYAKKAGLASLACETEEEAFQQVKNILDYLPSNCEQGEVGVATGDDPNRAVAGLEDMVLSESYSGAQLVAQLADDGKFIELSDSFGEEFSVGFASIDGFACGILAGNPQQGSQITSAGAKKCADFIRLCDSFALPVVTLCDCDGYSAEDEVKHPELMRSLAELSMAYAQTESPMITAIVGRLTGSAFGVLGSKAVGADMVFALPTAVISPMSAESAVEFMLNDKLAQGLSKEELLEKWETEISSPIYAAKEGYVDYICQPHELRARLAAALNMLGMKAAF